MPAWCLWLWPSWPVLVCGFLWFLWVWGLGSLRGFLGLGFGVCWLFLFELFLGLG